MAERYASFQGKEPDIDVNLFVNAVTAGIAQGNAQDTMLGSIAKGIKGGIEGGTAAYSGIQRGKLMGEQAEALSIENELSNDPEVKEARRQRELAGGAAAQTQAEIQNNNRSTIADTAALILQQQKDESVIKSQDASAALNLNNLSKGQDLNAQMGVFRDPLYSGYFARNPGEGAAYVQALKMRGGDPIVLDPLADQFSKMDYANRSRAGRQATQSLGQKAAEEDARDAGRFENTLLATPEADKYVKADNVDYRLFGYQPSKTVNKATGTAPTYDLVYGDQVIRPNAIVKDQYEKKQKELEAWVATNAHTTGYVPPTITNPSPQQPERSGPVAETGVGLAASSDVAVAAPGFTEKDITPVGGAKQAEERLNTGFLRGAVSIGGFSADTVENNVPAFNSLSKTIGDIVKSPTPDNLVNRHLLETSIQNTAKQLAVDTFNSDASLQASYTMADVEKYNSRFSKVFAGKSALDINAAEVENVAVAALVKDLRVTNPADLYFVTNGTGYVKQVDTYAKKVLLANKQAKEQQLKNSARNSNTTNILKDISDG